MVDPGRKGSSAELWHPDTGAITPIAATASGSSTAVTLHLQGHRGAETARLLGWSAKRAENLIYRGLADLRACLEARGMGR